MSQTAINQRLRTARAHVIVSLVVNGLLPLVVYALVRPLLANDASALAIAGAIPAVRTMALWLWRRRVERCRRSGGSNPWRPTPSRSLCSRWMLR